jgi:hypothetical protein
MWGHDDAVEGRIAGFAGAACQELFAAYAVELEPIRQGWPGPDGDERLISGSIGFVGRHLRGSCLLAATEGPIRASCPESGAARDWVGELTNQFVGRLKTKLLGRGVEVFVTTPIILSGVRIQPLPRGTLEPFVFVADSGRVMGWVEVQSDEHFEFCSAPPACSGAEGDVILF